MGRFGSLVGGLPVTRHACHTLIAPVSQLRGLSALSPRDYVRRTAEELVRHYTSGVAALHDLTDLRNADDNTRKDYAGRFAFELLQNGADAHEKAVRKRLPEYRPR